MMSHCDRGNSANKFFFTNRFSYYQELDCLYGTVISNLDRNRFAVRFKLNNSDRRLSDTYNMKNFGILCDCKLITKKNSEWTH